MRIRSGDHWLLFTAVAVVAGIAVGAAVFAVAAPTVGVLAGVAATAAIAAVLFAGDVTILGADGIVVRRFWRKTEILWGQVQSATFARVPTSDTTEYWALMLQPDDLELLRFEPVVRSVGNAYEFRKREQLQQLMAILQDRGVAIEGSRAVRTNVATHWKLD